VIFIFYLLFFIFEQRPTSDERRVSSLVRRSLLAGGEAESSIEQLSIKHAPTLRQIWEKNKIFYNPLTPYFLITYLFFACPS